MSKAFICCFFLFWTFIPGSFAQEPAPGRSYAAHSVLHAGAWYKIGVTGSGLYKIDRSLLQTLGLPVDQLDPRHLQLYGNGGAMLPQLNREARPDDLTQNAVWVAGENDGRLDAADYLLFYAPGPHRWHYDALSRRFTHETNLYADTAYYFITVGTTPGRRVTTQPVAGTPTETITSYHDHQVREQDLVNVLKSGRNWYGEAFNSLQLARTFSFPLPDVVAGTSIHLTAAVMGNSEAGSSFQVSANNTLLGTHTFYGRGRHDYHAEGEADTRTFTFPAQLLTTGSLLVNLSYNPQGLATATGYLDYLEVNAERALKFSGNQLAFRSTRFLGSNKVVAFQIGEVPGGATLWEISDPLRPRALPLQLANGTASFPAPTDSLREYLVFAGADFPRPLPAGKVSNQDLHALNQQGQLDFVILTHPQFVGQATRLARHREQHDQLQVAVVTTTQVYNEFSSGAQDVTAIRDFMKMIYDRRGPGKKLYLLLFGDASYDYKSRLRHNTNLVPVYASRESLDPLSTYSSEDYYGLLDEHEGLWSESQLGTPETLDIGIGRLPVKSASEAEAAVNKILHYDGAASFGKWRNRITFLADDGDNAEHLRDAESLAEYLEKNQPAYQLKKLYLDLYQQQSLPNGQRSPATNADLNQAIEQGTLLLNYTGHGNETTLAHEEILTLPQIEAWRNYDRLVFMLTATCEFGRYDDPARLSGAEVALLHPSGGAIGLLTTTRPVYASTNRVLNRNFMQMAFTPVNGQRPRLGDLVVKTKNSSQANNRNFALLADPTLQLASPSLRAQVTAINALPVQGGLTDTLQALQKVSLAGSITDEAGLVQSHFDGVIEVSIFDKPTMVKTLGDESSQPGPAILNIKVRENLIYSGTATVRQGTWTLDFVVPKDISYHIGPGLISLYAYNATTDAQGLSEGIAVGGTFPAAEADKTPPQIRLFLDDESFVDGGLASPQPVLLARLFDASGINTTGIGIGHEITATLDGDPAKTFVLNNYYTADQDQYQAGKIRFPLPPLSPGWHELKLKAWDTHNNPAEARLRFRITGQHELTLADLAVFPNPFTRETTFRFDHNRAHEDLAIQIHIFTVTGKIVKRLHTRWPATYHQLPHITWDGKDDFGAPVAAGVYLFRVSLRSTASGLHTVGSGRLIKSN